MNYFGRLVIACLGIILLYLPSIASAETLTNSNQITINSFTGIYHLSRDSRGLSLLTSEETIVADFGNGIDYGLRRVLPQKYQNHSVDLKILTVSDAAGDPFPYKTTTDNNGDLEIVTGDPSISLYGNHTIKIRYQTRGVINLAKSDNEFVLNVNGRGWDQPIDHVNASLHVPASFQARLKGDPNCYIALGNINSGDCKLSVKKSSQETMVTAQAGALSAHQALVLKLAFQPDTFTNSHASLARYILPFAVALLAILGLSTVYARRKTISI